MKRVVSIGAVAMLAMELFVAHAAHAAVVPEAAPPGATVTITGKGFGKFKSTGDNQVFFNRVPALIQQWEPGFVSVKVPLHATNGPVEVRQGKKTTAVGTFTVHQPTIREVTPREVEPGALLQIAGSAFGNTAGSKDPNTMFGVNEVLVSGTKAKIRRWKDDRIEVEVPATATTGEVVVRLASSDPLPDGSCCAPVGYAASNTASVTVLPSIRIDPTSGPVGTKVVLFGNQFGDRKGADDAVLIGGKPTPIAQWTNTAIVLHIPLEAESGPVVLRQGGKERALGPFTVRIPKGTGLSPAQGPIGSLIRISGENFGLYSESGATPYSFVDFNKGDNGVEIGGVPAIVYRWHDDRIDVWVPYSATGGPVVVKRGASAPNADGTCCAKKGLVTTEVGTFTVTVPKIDSFAPTSAGLDEIVTIKGSGFGEFLKTREATQPGLNEGGHEGEQIKLGENVARSEVLFNGIAGVVVSWTDTEIQARVPRRQVFGFGRPNEFLTDMTTGPLLVRRGSWDLLPDGSCCTPKKWVTVEAGQFQILPRGLPDQGYFLQEHGAQQ